METKSRDHSFKVNDQWGERRWSPYVGVCIGGIGLVEHLLWRYGTVGMSENSKKPLFRTEAQCVGVRLVQCGNGVISLGSGQCHAATRRATTQLSRCSPAMLVPTTPRFDTQKRHQWVAMQTAYISNYWNMCRTQRKKTRCIVFCDTCGEGIWKSTNLPSSSNCVFAPMCLFEGSLDTTIISWLQLTQFTSVENPKCGFQRALASIATQNTSVTTLQTRQRRGEEQWKSHLTVCPTQPIVNSTNNTHSSRVYRTWNWMLQMQKGIKAVIGGRLVVLVQCGKHQVWSTTKQPSCSPVHLFTWSPGHLFTHLPSDSLTC